MMISHLMHGHRLVPFVLEEGGRFGDHALSLLDELAWYGALSGKLKTPASWHCSSHQATASFWLRKWKQDISGWLQTTMSDTLLHPLDSSFLRVWALDFDPIGSLFRLSYFVPLTCNETLN